MGKFGWPRFEPVDHRHVSAKPLQIPGAIDIGDLFQSTDRQGHEHHASRKVTEVGSMGSQARRTVSSSPSHQRENANDTHQIAPTGVQQLVRPPVVPCNPLVRRDIEKEATGNHQIAVERREQQQEQYDESDDPKIEIDSPD